jgi:ribosomal protein S18 acetylase RimI-like enzyme
MRGIMPGATHSLRSPLASREPTMSGSERQRSVEISRATADEAASIASVLHQAFAKYQSLYTAEAFAITTPSPAEIEQRWDEGPVWSVVKDGRLVGTVAATAKGDALYIRSMAVVPSAKGQGIGKMLLVEVERFARAGGFQRMLLSTTPFLDDAIRLYQRFGFERIREGPHDLAGTPLFAMEKAVR